jgi:hypothetical protein
MSYSQDRPERDSASGPPTWVKLFGLAAAVVIVVIVVLHLTGNSLGGPGLHGVPVEHGSQQP